MTQTPIRRLGRAIAFVLASPTGEHPTQHLSMRLSPTRRVGTAHQHDVSATSPDSQGGLNP